VVLLVLGQEVLPVLVPRQQELLVLELLVELQEQ
jgi:hypothetical protein